MKLQLPVVGSKFSIGGDMLFFVKYIERCGFRTFNIVSYEGRLLWGENFADWCDKVKFI